MRCINFKISPPWHNNVSYIASQYKHLDEVKLFMSLIRSFMLEFSKLVNPFKPDGISQSYQLDHSISVLRVVGWYIFFFFFIFI